MAGFDNPTVILLKVSTCHMSKETAMSLLNKTGHWTTADGLHGGSVGNMSVYGIQRILHPIISEGP